MSDPRFLETGTDLWDDEDGYPWDLDLNGHLGNYQDGND